MAKFVKFADAEIPVGGRVNNDVFINPEYVRVCGSFVSAAGVLRRSSDASQSPAHSFVPLTVPTSLQPVGPFGVICTNGLLPTFGTFGV